MAAMANSSLADVLHAAPTIFTFLRYDNSLNVLLVTNTGMRNLVQQYVTHITFPDQSHMPTFAQNHWPNLQRISFRSFQEPSAVAGQSHRGWWISMLLAKLDLDAFVAMRSNSWPWQMFADLALYFGHGLPVDLHTLSTCQWPLLETLCLLDGKLDDAHAAVIFRADWPLLRSLRLPHNCLMHLEGVDHSRWPQLESVCLRDNPVSNTGLQRLVSAQWPKLTSFTLSSIALSAGGSTLTWHQLIEVNWPMLSDLDVSGNMIKATMMKNIVAAQFSCIRKLNLTHSALDNAAVGHLVKAPWLQLFDLNLNSALCGSTADCIVLLSTGAWPQLAFLWLSQNRVNARSLHALAKGKWPSLYYVSLIFNNLSRNDFRLMDAGGDAACDEPRDICRKFWPQLHSVDYE